MAVDQLVSGADDEVRPRRLLRLLAVGLAALAVAGVVLVRADRDRQLDALVTAATRAEKVVRDARASLGGLVRYSNGLLGRTDLAPVQRTAVLDTFALDSMRFVPRMAGPRAAAARVRVMPWDDDLATAKAAVLARIDAWTSFVDAAQADPERILLERRETRRLRMDAAEAVEAAAGAHGGERVEQLVAGLRTL